MKRVREFQRSDHQKCKRYCWNRMKVVLFLLALSPPGLMADPSLSYSSRGVGLQGGAAEESRVYTLHQIERLSRPVSPGLIQILDFRYYGTEGLLREGILFTVDAKTASEVVLSGSFNNWDITPMKRNEKGIYFYILPLLEDQTGKPILSYEYKFRIDGLWRDDPVNKNRRSDGMGGYYSIVRVHEPPFDKSATVRLLPGRFGKDMLVPVEFRIYLPEAQTVTIVGAFNHWNPEHDYLKSDRRGLFTIVKKLPSGRHCYKYFADGKWILDRYNPETGLHPVTGERVSCFTVP